MPPSQLKRLKASLRDQGIVGPQRSKKQKKQNAQNGADKEKRVNRTTALNGIREQFNPFEYRMPAKGPKFEVTTSNGIESRNGKGVIRRPGAANSRDQERLDRLLDTDIRRRNKVGGILDKRFGENDPRMAPEEKMLERFTREKQSRHSKSSAFDLEDDDMPGELTHMGQSLSLDGPAIVDDFDEDELELSDAEDHPSDEERQSKKRRRISGEEEFDDEEDGEEGNQPERKKSKQEVMKEVIAKSKLHKYERQAAKDNDEDLREELDKELSNIHELLRGIAPRSQPVPVAQITGMDPDRAALLNGTDKIQFDKDYDMQVKKLTQDKRSKPTERSKTEDERVAEESRKLQDLEAKRLRRMQGAPESSDGEHSEDEAVKEDGLDMEEEDFGLGSGVRTRPSKLSRPTMAELGIDDEDDFLIDEDLVASDSDIEPSDEDSGDDSSQEDEGDDDVEFLEGLLTEEESKRPEFLTGSNAPLPETEPLLANGVNGDLAYTFVCPESHEELLQVTRGVVILDLPTVVQRIRALYHPKLKAENKAKLGNFAVALVDHIYYLANQPNRTPFSVLETLIRHIHSLAKTFPVEIANSFRSYLAEIQEGRALSPTAGDLVLFTAIGTIFPTSDHFHQVVTPAILSMGRYIGQKIPYSLSDYTTGAYLCTLCLQYQKLSRRYIPELISFIENTLCALTPTKLTKLPGNFPYHEPKGSVRIEDGFVSPKQLSFYDCMSQDIPAGDKESSKMSLLMTNLELLDVAADIWAGKPAFTEVFEPVSHIIQHLESKRCRSKLSEATLTSVTKLSLKLQRMLKHAHLARRPLELHHHRPLAIKTSIPKFEESYNPDRHYDPDKERTEASKLKKEYKREKKGAIRDLRKDAKSIAREALKDKKERDAAYEKKYKRLVAEIQGEEGRESKAYEREKEWRKKGRK
ncbi:putative nucleolar complex 14 [Hyphodiscus hymeniophilus]|uniref:Nucleolar complex 14 n=1 Tax=Hyphodiscus hymeniophilus TaxID=353542 RepID=A0A9P7AZC3_9HELO|nr:putative nucleolar complex 14 [Hyphodiscus hymeniophilus]